MSAIYYCADWRDRVAFSNTGPKPTILADIEKLKAVLAGLEAGQATPVHPESAGVFTFLEGTGWMTVDDDRFAVQPGSVVIVPADALRGVEATTRLVFLAVRLP